MPILVIPNTDAANDCMSALLVYYKLLGRTLFMEPSVTPDDECFMFDAVGGALRVMGDPIGRLWFPFNPHYDPAPLGSERDPLVEGRESS